MAGRLGSTSSFRSSRSYLHISAARGEHIAYNQQQVPCTRCRCNPARNVLTACRRGIKVSCFAGLHRGTIMHRGCGMRSTMQQVHGCSTWTGWPAHARRTGELMPPYSYAHGSV